MPGYCDELANSLDGTKFSVTYNPEFIAQGSIIKDQQQPDQILIGEGHDDATKFLVDLYSNLCVSNPQVHVMSRLSAEITKLATNCYLTMKISFANSIGDLARSVGAEEGKILSAIGSDSRIGTKYLNYGFGFGGPCFPRDNHALLAYSNHSKVALPLSKATIEVNNQHLEFQLSELLNQNKEVYHFNSVAYKPNTDIIENSQQLELAKRLVDNGRKVVLTNANTVRDNIEKLFPSYFEFKDEK
jgi:nucleotide sugar dehydrogenase